MFSCGDMDRRPSTCPLPIRRPALRLGSLGPFEIRAAGPSRVTRCGRDQGGLKRDARTVQALHSLALAALVALAFYLGWALMTLDDRQLPRAVPAAATGTSPSH